MFKFILILALAISSMYGALDVTIGDKTTTILTNEEKANKEKFSFLKEGVPEPTECQYATCPTVKDEYVARVKNIDFKNGTTYCYVYERSTNKELGTVKQKNEICKNQRADELKNTIALFKKTQDDLDAKKEKNTKNTSLNIKEQKDFYFGSYTDTGDKEFLDASKYMIAGLTLDNNIININESVNRNKVILQDGYTMFPNAVANFHENSVMESIASFFIETREKEGSELIEDENTRLVSQASAMLSSINVFIMHFMGDYNESMLKLKAFLFFTIVPFTGLFLAQSKLTKKLSEQQDYDDIYERMFYTALTLFVFYFSTTTIKIDNKNFGEQTQISQSNFQTWFRSIFYEGAELATSVARTGTTAYLKYKIQDMGVVSNELLVSHKVQKNLLEKEQALIYQGKIGLLASCYNTFNTDRLKSDLGVYTSYNMTFPNKETMYIEDNILGKRLVNWYSSNTYINKGWEQTPLSANGCYNIERNYLTNKSKIEGLERSIKLYTNVSNDETISKQVDILTKTQYRNSAELGWIGFTMIPALNIALSELQIIENSTKEEIDKEYLKQLRDDSNSLNSTEKSFGTDTGHFISEYVSGVAYMMLPMADNLLSMIEKGGQQTVKSIMSKIPFLGKLGAELIGTLATSIIAIILTIYIMKFLVVVFPLIGIIMAGAMVTAFYFFSVELYYIVSPFLIAFAMASQQGDIIKKYLKVGVALALKPLMIVISLVMAIWVYEFFNLFNLVLIDWNFDSIFAVKDVGGMQPMNTLFLTIAKEFIHIGINVVSFFVVFYMVLNGANMILDMIGLSDANVDVQSAIGSNIDNKSGKWNSGV